MNIALYINSFLPTIGGREIVVHQLALALNALGHKVRVIGPAGCWSHRKVRFDYPVHRWPTLKGLFSEQVEFARLLLDTAIWGCDVIHAHVTYPSGYTAAKLKAIRNYPLVVTPHGEDIHVVPEIGRGLRLNPLLGPKIQQVIQSADMITTTSAGIEASVLDAGGSREKIRRIPNGVDIERFQNPIALDVRKWLKLPSESRLIVTVGNYRLCKGHEVLVQSLPHILAREPHARLIIVGRNNDALLPLIRKLDMSDKVILTGPIKLDWLVSIYCNSDVYVSAGMAEGAEGLSLAMLDAMAAGVPVVATRISGNRDVIDDGENGFLVQPDDPTSLAEGVLRLLSSDDLRNHMGARAREVAGQYRWSEIARQYLMVYHQIQGRINQ